MTASEILVTSHVGRDIIQSSQLFRTLEAAVWEYVVNGLEYVEPGVRPEVFVSLDQRRKRITIADNGRGMSANELKHYFTMHAENLDRRKRIPGRGRFGTGKSAAFGIGTSLTVATVQGEVRNVVVLTRQAIDDSNGSNVPTEWKVKNEAVAGQSSGTVVTIDGVSVRRMATEPLVRVIERHLAFWRVRDPRVVVGTHECRPWQPDVVETREFRPEGELSDALGNDTLLQVNVTAVPLEEAYRGVAVTAGPGNLVAVETAGIDGKDFGNYLFGEVDAPALDLPLEDGTVVAFDAARQLKLNYSHPVAAALVGFIGASLEQVRSELVERHRSAKKEDEARRLAEAADEIADLLNRDLSDVAERFNEMRDVHRRSGALSRASGDENPEIEDFVAGDEQPGLLDDLQPRERTDTDVDPNPEPTPDPGIQAGAAVEDGVDSVSPRNKGKNRRRSGGLTVEFESLGADEERSLYDADRKAILINLDHPMVAAAKSLGGIDDVSFRRLAFEIAFTQYALVLAKSVYEKDPAITADDALYEVRDALRRVTAMGATLYS
jgi:hypothetical protein